MAPPRQRPVPVSAASAGSSASAAAAATAPTAATAASAILDDSRSEASSTRERQGTTKGRKPAAATASSAAANTSAPSTGSNAALKEGKGPAADPRMDENSIIESQASINWTTMPLPVLHEYRYAYNLSCPSAFSSQINSILLSQGPGLGSATAISIKRRQLLQQSQSERQQYDDSMQIDTDMDAKSRQEASNTGRPDKVLHRLSAPAQGRVSKTQLASAVRKHFNNTAISEQDAIARFLYKVNEERRGKEFRLRFQP
ncbi:hypothetical protein MGYG_07561 [Nannizzia gypsea CBS 118893]|uniref:Histone deacetylase complex subunit SAP30 Sin3 binding domain-containing protein n=1 Tax=Arthroderma gypseum (strain ATCC MYA-4604 / CBS 118893) TaxID=535722 RepID=E4V3I2_ARTGP|nr:hypothetical protein MGYG_07561 [Nannizzia gypsea CBS 118893]EFR04556.1 hypothetical protein MGYG_07561 [Nannizzia gypsea CBS 118893]